MTLTLKQERFVSEDLNATQAAIRAGYSEKTAQEQSSRLLSNVIVQQAVSDAQNRVYQRNNRAE
jgi:phage terminase small subunit